MVNSISSELQAESQVILESLATEVEEWADEPQTYTATGALYMLPGGIFHEVQDTRGTLYYAAVVGGKLAFCLDLDEAREVPAP